MTLRSAFLSRLTGLWPLAILVAFVCVCNRLGNSGGIVLESVTTTATINLILVVGLYAFVGMSGIFSFGHISFMAIGAYVGALLAMPVDTKRLLLPDVYTSVQDIHVAPVIAILLGATAAAGLAAVLSLPLMRLRGPTARLAVGLAMFAVLNICLVVLSNLDRVTGGSEGVNGVPITTTNASALLWALLAITAVWLFQRTRVGLRVRGAREDEIAALASGVRVVREQRAAFILSAFVTGIGGAVAGQYLGSFNPQAFYLDLTFLTIVMLVVGGKNSLSGAVLGAVVVSALNELFRRMERGLDLGVFTTPERTGLQTTLLAIFVILILVRRPSGLTGGREFDELLRDSWPFRRSQRRVASVGDPAGTTERS